MNKRKISVPLTGGISILTALVALALVVFSLLALTTARSSKSLSDAAIESEVWYRDAAYQANAVLAGLRLGNIPDGATVEETDEGTRVDYYVPISLTQDLHVSVLLDGDTGYRLLRWQSVPVGEWDPDRPVHVWDGETF